MRNSNLLSILPIYIPPPLLLRLVVTSVSITPAITSAFVHHILLILLLFSSSHPSHPHPHSHPHLRPSSFTLSSLLYRFSLQPSTFHSTFKPLANSTQHIVPNVRRAFTSLSWCAFFDFWTFLIEIVGPLPLNEPTPLNQPNRPCAPDHHSPSPSPSTKGFQQSFSADNQDPLTVFGHCDFQRPIIR